MSNDDANGFPPQPGQPNDGSGFPAAPNYNDPPAAPGQPPAPGTPPTPGTPPAPGQPPAPNYGQPPAAPQYDQQPPAPQYGQAPPPPQPDYGQAPPPPGAGQPPQQPGFGAPPGYVAAGQGGMVKAPRPDVKIGAILVIVGSVLSIIGVFLPWASGGGESVNGMDDFIFMSDGSLYFAESPGTIPIVFAVIMLAFGVTLLLAGRVLAVAILAIIGAVIALFIGLAMIGIATGLTDDISSADLGIGAIIQPIAPLVSLAGAIVATSKRRKMVPAEGVQPPFYG
ncbi:hypothetical protein [Ilumatobacter coccineus]|nr:hypothetical protein [Ilumatobacter coccineus]